MVTPYDTRLPADLQALKEEIEQHARDYGLDFFETIFEVVDGEDLNEIAAYGGFPTRYPHWSFGMAFEELKKGYDYGLSKIYEMVINNDPCYAYLMRCNHAVDQKLVMAHVYGHCLAPETKVETDTGVRRITDVNVGDKVLTHTGAYREVRVLARREYKGEICCIRVNGHDEVIRITPEHPIYVLRRAEVAVSAQTTGTISDHSTGLLSQYSLFDPKSVCEMVWVEAGDIIVGDKLIFPIRPDKDNPPGEDDEYVFSEVVSVEREDYNGLVYNFSVDTDESYTLASGMVVHNCDFFKNNAYFAHTSRKMMDEMANHGMRIRRYVEKYGEDEVETFMDRCMSIDDLIDVHSVAIRRRGDSSRYDFAEEKEDDPVRGTRFKSKGYMDAYINPEHIIKAEEEEKRRQLEATSKSFPANPEKDILLFLINYAPLKPWQRDVLSIVRDEAYYFSPQGQTKIMNEGWACLESCSLVLTEQGFLPVEEIVADNTKCQVHDGTTMQGVYDWAQFKDRETVHIRTRRGLELRGSTTHQVKLPDGSWKRLDQLAVGDRVAMSGGHNVWPTAEVPVDWNSKRRLTLQDIANSANVDVETVIRYRRGVRGRHAETLAPMVAEYESGLATQSLQHNRRQPIRVPETVNEQLAAFLGYLTGDGHISETKRTIGLTTADEEQADHFVDLVSDLFDLNARKRWDDGRWRVGFSSQQCVDFLKHLGLPTGKAADRKTVPTSILRSPEKVVSAFLRAYFDCDGYAGKQGVILSTASEDLGKTVQLLLLNYGILSRRRKQGDGCWHVHIAGRSAKVFAHIIGFGLQRKQLALQNYIEQRIWWKQENWDDEIVSIERSRADVYDFSVENSHCYVAQGFINHNSYWHSTIMTQKVLTGSEVIDYADHHSGTMATSPGRLNPYKLGIELFRDIEHRWNTGKFGKEYDECDDMETRRKWDKQLGLGRKKIFEVRKIYNDITFIDEFLTPEFCVKYKLFTFAYDEHMGQYFIEAREFEKIKQRLLFGITNLGRPWIYVVDGNYRNRGELLLKHGYNGMELKLDQAADTLTNIQSIWSRPVHLQTVVEDKPTLLSFDGSEHSIQTLGEADDERNDDHDHPF